MKNESIPTSVGLNPNFKNEKYVRPRSSHAKKNTTFGKRASSAYVSTNQVKSTLSMAE